MYSIVVDREIKAPGRDGRLACLRASYLDSKYTTIVLLPWLFPIQRLSFPHQINTAKNVSESADESLDWGRGAGSLSVQSLAYVCISQWIIKTTAPVSLSLSFHDFISDCVHVPLSWYRAPQSYLHARRRNQKLVVLLLHTMYVKCLISLSFYCYFLSSFLRISSLTSQLRTLLHGLTR